MAWECTPKPIMSQHMQRVPRDLIGGTVLKAEQVQKTGNIRSSWFITADHNLGGGTVKRARSNAPSVKLEDLPSLAPLLAETPPIAPPAPPIAPPMALLDLLAHPLRINAEGVPAMP